MLLRCRFTEGFSTRTVCAPTLSIVVGASAAPPMPVWAVVAASDTLAAVSAIFAAAAALRDSGERERSRLRSSRRRSGD